MNEIGVIAFDVEAIRVGVGLRVAMGTAQAQQDLLSLADLHTPELDVAQREALDASAIPEVEAQDLVYCALQQGSVGAQLRELVWVAKQRTQREGTAHRGGLTAGGDQDGDHRHDLVVRHAVVGVGHVDQVGHETLPSASADAPPPWCEPSLPSLRTLGPSAA